MSVPTHHNPAFGASSTIGVGAMLMLTIIPFMGRKRDS